MGSEKLKLLTELNRLTTQFIFNKSKLILIDDLNYQKQVIKLQSIFAGNRQVFLLSIIYDDYKTSFFIYKQKTLTYLDKDLDHLQNYCKNTLDKINIKTSSYLYIMVLSLDILLIFLGEIIVCYNCFLVFLSRVLNPEIADREIQYQQLIYRMSNHKNKKCEQSPFTMKKPLQKSPRLIFDFNSKKLESLQCFFGQKRVSKPEPRKASRLKSISSVLLKPESQQQPQQSELNTPEEVTEERLPCRAIQQSKEQRKKETSNSPDISKLLMNQVIHKIEKEGIRSRWKEEEKLPGRQDQHSCEVQRESPPQEVQLIWLKQNRSHLSTDYTIVSNMSPRQDYPAYMMQYSYSNSYSGSFNASFTYSDDQYPDYYNDTKNDVINKRIFEINYESIQKDGRTTVMIKNIPNKYTRNLLYEEINQQHENTYDFLYLPFDFNNNCNVGYAFINFLTPKYLKKFYECYNEKRWSKFRSLKICVLTYARLQGRQSLIEHFYNSKVLNQKEKRYRPIIKDLTQLETLLEKQRSSQPQ